jgi:hypothetical protein
MEMTPEQVERVANHIADFSLAYLHQVGTANREAAAQGSARNAQEKQNDRTANRSGRSAKSRPALAK